MGFFERKLKQAEGAAEALIKEYMALIEASPEAASVKQMAKGGAPATSVGSRAADAHRALFAQLVANAGRTSVLRSSTRRQIVEQFCVALWRKWIGNDGLAAMTRSLGLIQAPPTPPKRSP